MSTTTPIKVVILGDSSSAQKALRETGSDVEGFAGKTAGHMGKVAAVMGGAFAAFGAVSVIKGGIDSLTNMDRIMQQTAAVVKSTGGAAKVSADQVADFANSMERSTGVEAESIQTGQNMLLTFTNIQNGVGKGNDIFDQASKTMVDLATAMGGDTQGAAIQLGKALNDPMKGITALTKVGVTFDEGQKAQIKTMQEHGNIAGAQKVILAELNKEFGGSAEAFGKSGAGQIAKFKNELGNLQDQLASALLPVLENVTGYLATNLPKAVDFVSNVFHQLGEVWDEVLGGFQNPEATFGPSVGSLERGFITVGQKAREFADFVRNDVIPVLIRIKDVFVNDVLPALGKVYNFINNNINPILTAMGVVLVLLIPHYVALGVAAVASGIRQVASWVATNVAAVAGAFAHSLAVAGMVAGWVLMGVQAMLGAARIAAAWLIALGPIGLVIAAVIGVALIIWSQWDNIKRWTAEAFDWVWGKVQEVFGFLVNLFLNFTGPGLIISHWNSIKNATGEVWGWIQEKIGGVISWFEGIPGRIASTASGMWSGIASGLQSALNGIVTLWNKLDFGIHIHAPDWLGGYGFDIDDIFPDIPQLAKGGIVKARPGGTLVNVGEAGRDEMIVPLPRGGSGGSSRPVVVHFEPSYSFGNVYGVDDLQRLLDENNRKQSEELLQLIEAS